MGQQQLLLVILVTIIVGIATVVAINTFSAAADSANLDAVRQDVATIAASAQGFYMKPTMLGGGGQDFTDITFDNMAFPADGISNDGLTAQNQNGRYVISAANANNFTVTANPASDPTYTPGTIDANGLLTGGAAATDQLSATVEPDNLVWTTN